MMIHSNDRRENMTKKFYCFLIAALMIFMVSCNSTGEPANTEPIFDDVAFANDVVERSEKGENIPFEEVIASLGGYRDVGSGFLQPYWELSNGTYLFANLYTADRIVEYRIVNVRPQLWPDHTMTYIPD